MKKHIVLACVILFSIGLLSTLFFSCQRNQTTRRNDDRSVDRDRDRTDRGDRVTTTRGGTRGGTGSSGCERSHQRRGGYLRWR